MGGTSDSRNTGSMLGSRVRRGLRRANRYTYRQINLCLLLCHDGLFLARRLRVWRSIISRFSVVPLAFVGMSSVTRSVPKTADVQHWTVRKNLPLSQLWSPRAP